MKSEPAASIDSPPKATETSRVAAVIVLYNPRAQLLERLLDTLRGQVERIIVIDNSPQPCSDYPALFAASGTYYQALGENTGIAKAQNIGILRALEEKCSHVLLLDQDSALPPQMVAQLREAEDRLLESGTKVASVGPLFIHENTGLPATAIRHGFLHVKRTPIDRRGGEPMEADYLISSGSLIRADILRQVGSMLEGLFIDWVDVEWGLRARSMGLKSFVVPWATMQHTIGDKATTAFGRQINLHDNMRNYYIVRNATYLLRSSTMGWKWRLLTLLKIPQYVLFYSWHSSKFWKSAALLLRAVKDGVRGHLGRTH